MSNQDLKHFSKSDILGFAGAVFHGFLPPEGDLATKLYRANKILKIFFHNLLKYSLNNLVYYSLNSSHMCIEIVYASDKNNVEIEKVYTSTQTHDFRTIKGKHLFAIYFPSAVFFFF